MSYLFDRELPMARGSNPAIRWSVFAASVVAIGWLSTARADIGDAAHAGGSIGGAGVVADTTAAQSAQIDSQVNASTVPNIPDVSVTEPAPLTAQDLTSGSLYQFIVHHATTHFVNYGTTGNLARWRGGLQSICPVTLGLDPGYNAFVTARIRAVAAYVGAPVQSDPHCESNVRIMFTNTPQQSMDEITKWATSYFLLRYRGGGKRLIDYKADHAIQGWYMTTNGGAVVLNTDVSLVGLNLWPLWPAVTENYQAINSTGTRLGGGSGSGIGIGTVILIVDGTKVVGDSIGTIADYLAMLTLSVAQSPDHCDALPSILDLMASSCGTRAKPTGITAGDLAFLKALYHLNTGLGPSLSRDDIEANMTRQFNPH